MIEIMSAQMVEGGWRWWGGATLGNIKAARRTVVVMVVVLRMVSWMLVFIVASC